MDKEQEKQETQQTPESEEITKTTEEQVTLTKAEVEELRHKAEISSQNFERLKKAEARVKELENLPEDLTTEEEKEFKELHSKVSTLEATIEKNDILNIHPELKEVWSEFDEYRSSPENAGMGMKTAARAFIVEKLGEETKRKGLEKVRGGGKTPVKTGMSEQEIAELRKNNGKKYREKLKRGEIKFSA